MIYCIALNFGGAKLWRISLHKNFEVLNFGETSTKRIIVHNLENFGGLYLAKERQFAKFTEIWHHQSLALYGVSAVRVVILSIKDAIYQLQRYDVCLTMVKFSILKLDSCGFSLVLVKNQNKLLVSF